MFENSTIKRITAIFICAVFFISVTLSYENTIFALGASEITISGQTNPSGSLKLGGSFGIYGTISSTNNITKVWGGIYKRGTDDAVQYVEDFPSSKTYNLHGKFNDNLIFNYLQVGNYTYKIYAKDFLQTHLLISSDFSIGNASNITVSGQTVPSGTLNLGGNFGIYGMITSNNNITKVWGGIYKQGTDNAVQYVEDYPNSKSYSLHGKFNDNLIFNYLSADYYTYKIYATDSLQTFTLIQSNFTVGNPQSVTTTKVPDLTSKITISGETKPAGILKLGANFGIYGTITSNNNILKVMWYNIIVTGRPNYKNIN